MRLYSTNGRGRSGFNVVSSLGTFLSCYFGTKNWQCCLRCHFEVVLYFQMTVFSSLLSPELLGVSQCFFMFIKELQTAPVVTEAKNDPCTQRSILIYDDKNMGALTSASLDVGVNNRTVTCNQGLGPRPCPAWLSHTLTAKPSC